MGWHESAGIARFLPHWQGGLWGDRSAEAGPSGSPSLAWNCWSVFGECTRLESF
jgi:hypothetical protein